MEVACTRKGDVALMVREGGMSTTDSITTRMRKAHTNALILHSVPGGDTLTTSRVMNLSSTGEGSPTSQSFSRIIDGRPKWATSCLSQMYTHQKVRFLTSSSMWSNRSCIGHA